MKLRLLNKEIELTEIRYKYLYSYLLRFCLKNNIYKEWNGEIITIPMNLESEFRRLIEIALLDLLESCYKEPSLKEIMKYPNRFEKITIKNELYIINYRTDMVGIIAFGLYHIYRI